MTLSLTPATDCLMSRIDLAPPACAVVLGGAVFAGRRPELYLELLTERFTWKSVTSSSLYGHGRGPGQASRMAVAQFAPW